jgi:hypothetical protein
MIGGDCARINPAPLTPFLDIFAMGDGKARAADRRLSGAASPATPSC